MTRTNADRATLMLRAIASGDEAAAVGLVSADGYVIDRIAVLAGKNDFVFIAAHGTVHATPCVYLDLYRVEEGLIVERWGFSVDEPSQDQQVNTHGLL